MTKTSNRTGAATIPNVVTGELTRPIVIFYWYRQLLSLLFLSWVLVSPVSSSIGSKDPELFRLTAIFYAALCLVQGMAMLTNRLKQQSLAVFMVITDIITLTLMSQASGGVGSGLGIVLAGSIAAGALLLHAKWALALAAIAAVAFMSAEWWLGDPQFHYPALLRPALFGVTFMATAAIVSVMASRARASEALAQQRGVDLANLAQLSQFIIERMDMGIIVTAANGKVRMMNDAAWFLLGMPASRQRIQLPKHCPELSEQWASWKRTPEHNRREFRATGNELQARFARMSRAPAADTLIFIEDSATIKAQAQSLKLASLGRLTASIAHEIRNPLGALSHASQLLAEGSQLDNSDQRLVEIIRNHTVRMNEIIENVMRISREQPSRPVRLNLLEWMNGFMRDIAMSHHTANIRVNTFDSDLEINFDESQLHQIITNLCDNALKHGQGQTNDRAIEIRVNSDKNQRGVSIDVIDFGKGIATDEQSKIFEPFYTTTTGGTGLGLYLTRELCESNGATIEYVSLPTSGSCFRVFVPTNRLTQP